MASEGSGSWAKLGAYAVAWKYLIYVLIMKEVSRRKVHLKKGEASRIYKYIRDHHANDNASKLSALVSYLKRMEGLKIGKYEASVKTRELERLYKLEEIHHLLPGLQEIASQRRIIVLVDELDRGWDSSEDAQAFVAGLFQACLSVNSLHDNLRVYISLRQERTTTSPRCTRTRRSNRDLPCRPGPTARSRRRRACTPRTGSGTSPPSTGSSGQGCSASSRPSAGSPGSSRATTSSCWRWASSPGRSRRPGPAAGWTRAPRTG